MYSLILNKHYYNARDWSRTSTTLRSLAPQATKHYKVSLMVIKI